MGAVDLKQKSKDQLFPFNNKPVFLCVHTEKWIYESWLQLHQIWIVIALFRLIGIQFWIVIALFRLITVQIWFYWTRSRNKFLHVYMEFRCSHNRIPGPVPSKDMYAGYPEYHTGPKGAARWGVWGAKPTTNFVFSQMDKFMDKILSKFQKSSYLHERCGMCWNEWKINILMFAVFSFWVMVVFVLKIGQFFN